MGHYRPAARWGGWALGWAGWWGAPKQGLTAPTALLSRAVLMPMGTYFYESFQDLFSSSARCPFFRQMISSPIVICSALDAEATPEPLPEPLTQRTGKVRGVCKPWLRAVGAEGCDRPSRAHRGSARVHTPTPAPDLGASTEPCLAFQQRAKGKGDRASAWDTSPNQSITARSCPTQKASSNPTPTSPPAPLLICHKAEADLGVEGEHSLSRTWHCLNNTTVSRAEKLKVEFPLEKGEIPDTGTYRTAALAAPLACPALSALRLESKCFESREYTGINVW